MNRRDMFWSLNYSPHAAISFCRSRKNSPPPLGDTQIEVKNIVVIIISNVIIIIFVVIDVVIILFSLLSVLLLLLLSLKSP